MKWPEEVERIASRIADLIGVDTDSDEVIAVVMEEVRGSYSAGLEDAAKVCAKLAKGHTAQVSLRDKHPEDHALKALACAECADAIRALKEQP